ncbi:MAG: hypothetical protein IJD00_03835 [Clostridia bacterium]|nr:hypothetical protein [Clostridia bacterium]
MGITSIKTEAKAALRGNWISAIITTLMALISFLIIQNIGWVLSLVIGEIAASLIALFLTVLLCGPLTLGVFRYFWRMHGRMNEAPASAFYYFSSAVAYRKAIRLCFILAIRLLGFALLYFLPAIAIYVISSQELYDFLQISIPIWSQHLAYLVNFFSTIGTVLTVITFLRFYLAPILVIADDQMDAEEAIHMSAVIARASVLDFIFLTFSLILWIILSFLFIPLIFTLPYFVMCYVLHSLHSIKEYNEKIKKLNDESFPSFVAGI